ncbi:hypothetical protein [Nonomuraea gerenzanensis]|uniref:Chitinase n=1 Tax=Nonomuraea gerenzanensis TaxID=93944 RepID=A0A1M4ECE1_9ACTN|nr:hypothetical protein [Nonomuraea gerenzanensis]UBU18569.1 hypothetical protein LCN96_27170 [Nonomuraea gerenzanensis]SBO96412.1 hypothetical protein BN4615_P5928 [Nonomuraea gerenzanensis]
MRRSIRWSRGAAAVGTVALVAAAVTSVQPAGAVPAAQAGCQAASFGATPALGWLALTAPRTVTVTSSQFIKAEVTADVGVDAGAELRLGWAINGSAPFEGTFGPANFANHQEFFETRSTFALISVGAGTTTVQPFVRLIGASAKRATVLHRCSSAEGNTS